MNSIDCIIASSNDGNNYDCWLQQQKQLVRISDNLDIV